MSKSWCVRNEDSPSSKVVVVVAVVAGQRLQALRPWETCVIDAQATRATNERHASDALEQSAHAAFVSSLIILSTSCW